MEHLKQKTPEEIVEIAEVVKKPNYRAYYFTIFSIGLTLIAIALTATLFFFRFKVETAKITTIPSTAASPSPTIATTSSEQFSDWQTYKNIEFGYEFKYPGNWKRPELASRYQQFIFTQNEKPQFPGYNGIAGGFLTIEKNQEDPENIGGIYESMYSSTSRCPELAGEIDLRDTVNVYCLTGKEVPTNAGTWKDAVECSALDYYYYENNPENCPHQFWLDTSNNFYSFHFHIFEPIKKGSTVDITINQILSTFRFLDQKDTNQSNWKSYENKELGMSFSYPATWTITTNDSQNSISIISPLSSVKEIYQFSVMSDKVIDHSLIDYVNTKVGELNSQNI